MPSRLSVLALAIVVLFTGLFYFQQKKAQSPLDHKLRIVATVLPVYTFTKNIVGDLADVSLLVPPGTEIHEYSLSPADAAAVANAEILVKNGLGIDDWVNDFIEDLSKPPQIVNASSLINTTKPGLTSTMVGAQREFPQNAATPGQVINPHIWVNPAYAVHMVEEIRNALMQADPEHANDFATNAERYLTTLLELDGELHGLIASLANPTFVAEEPSITYFAAEYGLNQAAIVSSEPEAPVKPQDLVAIERLMRQQKINVILKNKGSESKAVATIAKDVGAKVYEFDAFEFGTLDAGAYEKAMRKNIEMLRLAFPEKVNPHGAS